MSELVSGCCRARVFRPDKNGHGFCLDCKEHCTSVDEATWDDGSPIAINCEGIIELPDTKAIAKGVFGLLLAIALAAFMLALWIDEDTHITGRPAAFGGVK